MVTLAKVFQQHAHTYQTTFTEQLLPSHKQAIQAILQCRTEALGGHIYTCEHCHHVDYRYHSCRNRHCPQCQGDKAQQWLSKQQENLLPVPHFMLTFTLPAELRSFARSQQKLFYNVLFRASAAATQDLALDPARLGGQIGMMGVLHTWGRNLTYHPHVHYLVPAGAWDGMVWRYGRQHRFFLPVKALSILFRAKFRDALKQADCFAQIPASVWTKEWVVHCQPVGRGHAALKYLAAYLFRVAISNQRIVSSTEKGVTFRYQPSGTSQWLLSSLSPMEFMRRFLQHVLPKGFVKVRYYGFFSSGQRAQLQQIMAWFTLSPTISLAARPATETMQVTATADAPNEAHVCPHCGHSLRWTRQLLPTQPRGKPP